ncbi:MAG: UDP-3-O-(3-hydroxymyristoyl)glucosamine N-acyltransferase [Parachlamydiales bacterium]|nr:UDP-3-O-(3-hydroxymyristoyl)glucosamine N-acyltransferase [Parachlamydiales bacterium]
MRAFTLKDLSAKLGAELIGDPNLSISGVNTLEEASYSDASFLANPRYTEAMKKSNAGVICIAPGMPLPEGKNFFITTDPSRTFQQIAEILIPTGVSGFSGIHPSAVIHETAVIGPNVSIGPHAVIDRDAKIGANTRIGPNVSIGFEVEIGENCQLHPNCVVRERCRLGNGVILQPGAIIGSCGFGYTPDKMGRHIKLEQIGIVILEDDVEIGANTTIDRSRFKATIIRKGSKIDNLVQIAHNVEVGEHNVIAAQTGIAGSAKTGKYVMLGGQVGIVGHVELDDQVLVATRGGVSKSLKSGKYRGSPAIPITEFHRQEVHVRKLEEYVERIKELENKLQNHCG